VKDTTFKVVYTIVMMAIGLALAFWAVSSEDMVRVFVFLLVADPWSKAAAEVWKKKA
jgi:hypothetical protein